MGNYSVLWIAKDKENYNKETDELLEVKYAIPLFWIALFTQNDIHKTHYEDGEPYFFFETTIQQAIVNFQKRINLWATLYNNEKAEILAEVFLKYLEQYPNHDVTFNVDDVLSMYLLFDNEADKAEMIDMIQTIDQLNVNPKAEIPFKHWLSNPISLENPKDRYEIDGLGCELLPYPALDAYLEQQKEKISPIIKTEPTEHIKEEIRSQPKQNTTTQKSNPMYGYGLAILIILILIFYFNH